MMRLQKTFKHGDYVQLNESGNVIAQGYDGLAFAEDKVSKREWSGRFKVEKVDGADYVVCSDATGRKGKIAQDLLEAWAGRDISSQFSSQSKGSSNDLSGS
jgi:hypothetical protein